MLHEQESSIRQDNSSLESMLELSVEARVQQAQ
jgi:hypothetical protein